MQSTDKKLKWGILSWILPPSSSHTRGKPQVDANTSKVSERGKRAAPSDNEGFIRNVFTVVDFNLGKRRKVIDEVSRAGWFQKHLWDYPNSSGPISTLMRTPMQCYNLSIQLCFAEPSYSSTLSQVLLNFRSQLSHREPQRLLKTKCGVLCVISHRQLSKKPENNKDTYYLIIKVLNAWNAFSLA